MAFIAASAASEPLMCELLMSMAPIEAQEDSDWCVDLGDPRCQLHPGDAQVPASSHRFSAKAGVLTEARASVTLARERAFFVECTPHATGALSGIFRPPR